MLFDGEEEGPGCSSARFATCALRGSRAYVAAHRTRGRADDPARLHRQQGRAPAARGQPFDARAPSRSSAASRYGQRPPARRCAGSPRSCAATLPNALRGAPATPACATSSARSPAGRRRSSSARTTTASTTPRASSAPTTAPPGTAAVVELARDLRKPTAPAARCASCSSTARRRAPAARTRASRTCALRGSRAYVAAHRREVGQMVLLDYIANKGVRLPREGSSTPALWARVRAAADKVGVGAVFPPTDQVTIFDDHTPVPARRDPRGRPHRLLLPLRRRPEGHDRQALGREPGRRGRDGVRARQRVARGLSGDGRAGVCPALRARRRTHPPPPGRTACRRSGAARPSPRRRCARGGTGGRRRSRRRRRRRRRCARRAGCPRPRWRRGSRRRPSARGLPAPAGRRRPERARPRRSARR